MIRNPAFPVHLRVAITPPDLVFFISETGYRVIQGELLCRIAPLINGKRNRKQIAKHFKGQLDPIDIESGLLMFEAEGFLVEGGQRAAPAAVNIASYSKTESGPMWNGTLTTRSQGAGRRGLTLVLVDDYLQKELESFNTIALKKKKRWMIVKPTGYVFWFGPVFSPPDGACWNCLAIRLKEKRRVDAFLEANGGKEIRAASRTNRQTVTAALNLASLQLSKAIASGQEKQQIETFDPTEMKFERHPVIRREDCPACGNSTSNFPQPVRLKRKSGTGFESSLDRYKHHISFRTGIIDEIKAIGNHPVIHAVSADHLFVPNLEKKDLLRKGLTQKSWGKGVTLEHAQTGALCEALERYSGVFRGNEFRITKSQQQLGEKAIPVNACMNFSNTQYANREKNNETAEGHDWVPAPLDPDRKIEWTPVWSLTKQEIRYLPTAYCYYGYRLPPDHRFCRADSNGNAAGETLEQAVFHGFLELVERDCTAMWWFNRLIRPGVRIETFPDPYLHDVLIAYRKLNRELWAIDLTNDFGIPCFAALSQKKSGMPAFLIGLGAHFDPVTALIKAVTEMNQFLAVRIIQVRKQDIPAHRERDQSTGRSFRDAIHLRPDHSLRALQFDDYRSKTAEDPYSNVETCVRLAKERRMETFVLNQTRTDVGLPVVKVIVPGMRQIWSRFAPGRLYDVPVQLGWLKKSLAENELNKDRFLI